MKSPSKKLLISLLFIAAGIFMIFMALQDKKRREDPSMIPVTAVIEDITIEYGVGSNDSDTHHVYVTYSLDGAKKTARLNTYSSSMRIGNEVSVLIDPLNPSEAVSTSATGFYLYLILGILGILGGIGSFFKR